MSYSREEDVSEEDPAGEVVLSLVSMGSALGVCSYTFSERQLSIYEELSCPASSIYETEGDGFQIIQKSTIGFC